MATLDTYFSDQELLPIKQGIRTFIRLTGLISDDFQYRWFADEADAVSFVKSIGTAFHLTERMLSKSKYQGQPFDAVRQVREDLAGSMLTGHTESMTVANRKRYSPLYYLVIEPAITAFLKFDHTTILAIVDDAVEGIAELVNQCDDYGDFDDALVAQHQTRQLIHTREEAAKAVKATRKRGRKKEVVIEELEEVAEI